MKNNITDYFVDSSDEEDEEIVKSSIHQHPSYAKYLSSLTNLEDFSSPHVFKMNLGILVHNFAERFFRSSIIELPYLLQKKKLMTIEKNNYVNILKIIREAANNFILTDESLKDKTYIKLFNYIFNKNLNLSNNLPKDIVLKPNVNQKNFRDNFIDKIRELNIQEEFTPFPSLNLFLDNKSSHSVQLLSFSKLVNRHNKTQLKFFTINDSDNISGSSRYIFDCKGIKEFTDTHIYHYKTGNVLTEVVKFGSYKNFLKKIPEENSTRENFIKYVYDFIKDNNSSTDLESKDKNFAKQLVHVLFITEMHRNKSALFLSPMFLDLIKEDSSYISPEYFPISALNAVSSYRNIIKNFSQSIPNLHHIDYDKSNLNTTEGTKNFLQREGELLIKWLIVKQQDQSKIPEIISKISYNCKLSWALDIKIDDITINEIKNILNIEDNDFNDQDKIIILDLKKSIDYIEQNHNSNQNLLGKTKKFVLKKYPDSTRLTNHINNIYDNFSALQKKFLNTIEQNKNYLNIVKNSISVEIETLIKILNDNMKKWYGLEMPIFDQKEKLVGFDNINSTLQESEKYQEEENAIIYPVLKRSKRKANFISTEEDLSEEENSNKENIDPNCYHFDTTFAAVAHSSVKTIGADDWG